MRTIMSFFVLSTPILALTLGLSVAPSSACTGIRATATDGTVIQARTLEFGMPLQSEAIFVPRGFARTGSTPDGTPGMRWTSKYTSVGANGFGLPVMLNGVNEKGLAVGLFYFPDMAEYMPYELKDAGKTLSAIELGSYLLDNFANVDEVRAGVVRVVVPAVVLKQMGISPGAHFLVMDATGKSIVIEYTGGAPKIFDNPLGVITNCPTFDWHMTNLRNYVKMSPMLAPPLVIDDVVFQSFGQGSGMLGLPGDYTPPSRFVRAVAYSQSLEPASDGEQAVLAAFHVLNNFDIPRGSVRDGEKDTHGNIVCEETQWTCACDLKAKRFYFRTYDNSQIRMIDLTAMNPNAAEIVTFSMQGGEQIESLVPPAGKELAAAAHE
jgi:choloylglycine hydrolase